MKKKYLTKKAMLSGILCACLTLSGCVSSVQPSQGQVTLPPSYVSYTAPTGDSDIRRDQTVKLYVPDADGIRLVPVETTVSLNPFRWYAQELAEALFDYEGAEGQQFPGYESLFLNNVNPVEVSCGIATVNLNTAALSLSHEDLYTIFQALANTLCQFGDIHGVNLLIGGVQPGIDVASQSPAGTLSQNLTDDLSALWARAASVREAAAANRRITSTATLYFPAVSGAGVLAEARALVFQNASIPRLARTLLEALSEGPREVHAKAVPYLADLLSTLPSVSESGGERILTLRFNKELTARLQESGIPLSCLAASLCLTMTTFLPGINGVTVYIGTERLNSLTQEGTFQGAGTTLAFPAGVMRRSLFSVYVLGECRLYFASGDSLVEVRRAVPWHETLSPRYLIQELCQGSRYDDSVQGLSPTLPEDMSDSHLLGVTLSARDSVLILNFSSDTLDRLRAMDGKAARRMLYAMVNTLCENRRIRETCFFFGGKQAAALDDGLELSGTFLPNPTITRK